MNEPQLLSISAIGQDSHRFEQETADKPLVLGGVTIPGTPGLRGNSDADVILHALCNALSGLSGRVVLGEVTDRLCAKGIIDSREYVKVALETLENTELTYVSISVEARRPHLAPFKKPIRESVARLLSLSVDRVALTATSGEGLTAFGRGEGIQSFIIVSARRRI
jgi:2-C-methyl-D-erythritol 2,4-cyclodiphosphate synthase